MEISASGSIKGEKSKKVNSYFSGNHVSNHSVSQKINSQTCLLRRKLCCRSDGLWSKSTLPVAVLFGNRNFYDFPELGDEGLVIITFFMTGRYPQFKKLVTDIFGKQVA